jgi:hypothetical protein
LVLNAKDKWIISFEFQLKTELKIVANTFGSALLIITPFFFFSQFINGELDLFYEIPASGDKHDHFKFRLFVVGPPSERSLTQLEDYPCE